MENTFYAKMYSWQIEPIQFFYVLVGNNALEALVQQSPKEPRTRMCAWGKQRKNVCLLCVANGKVLAGNNCQPSVCAAHWVTELHSN